MEEFIEKSGQISKTGSVLFLKKLHKETDGSVVLIGSLARSEYPVSDIDIKIFSEKKFVDLDDHYYCNRPVNCKRFNLSESATQNLLSNSLRHFSIILDGEIIKADPLFINIFQECKKSIQKDSFKDYLHFMIEDENIQGYYNFINKINLGSYFSAKRIPGSRRTIDRIAKIYRFIFSDDLFEVKNTSSILEFAERRGSMPAEIHLAAKCVGNFLSDVQHANKIDFLKSVKLIRTFFWCTLVPKINNFCSHKVNKDYIKLVAMSKTRLKSKIVMNEVYNMPTSPFRWLLIFLLASNKFATREVFEFVYSIARENKEYYHFTRTLLKNPSFDLSIINNPELLLDKTSIELFKKRM